MTLDEEIADVVARKTALLVMLVDPYRETGHQMIREDLARLEPRLRFLRAKKVYPVWNPGPPGKYGDPLPRMLPGSVTYVHGSDLDQMIRPPAGPTRTYASEAQSAAEGFCRRNVLLGPPQDGVVRCVSSVLNAQQACAHLPPTENAICGRDRVAEPAPEKRIDEMSLADYRRGVGKVFDGGRLLP